MDLWDIVTERQTSSAELHDINLAIASFTTTGLRQRPYLHTIRRRAKLPLSAVLTVFVPSGVTCPCRTKLKFVKPNRDFLLAYGTMSARPTHTNEGLNYSRSRTLKNCYSRLNTIHYMCYTIEAALYCI